MSTAPPITQSSIPTVGPGLDGETISLASAFPVHQLPLSQIRRDPRIRTRVCVDHRCVVRYADAMGRGTQFPPISCVFDGAHYWLIDGYHRYIAAGDAGLESVVAEVRLGTHRDAMLYAVSANHAHGMRLTNADKRRGVERLLADEEWCMWSDCEIARRCGVTDKTVARLRRSGLGTSESTPRRFVSRHGTTSWRKPGTTRRADTEPRALGACADPEAEGIARSNERQDVIDELEFSLERALALDPNLRWLESGQRADLIQNLEQLLKRCNGAATAPHDPSCQS